MKPSAAIKAFLFLLLGIVPAATAFGAVNSKVLSAPVAAEAAGEEGVDPVPLSLNSIILFALDGNPDVRMALAREQQALAAKKQVAAGFYPVISMVVRGGGQYNKPFPHSSDESGGRNRTRSEELNLRQTIYDFGQTRDEYRSRQQFESSARLDTASNIETVMEKTITNYLQILRFQKVVSNDEEFVKRMRALTKTVNDMFTAGGASKAMLNYAQSRLAAAETTLNSSRSNLNDAMSNLESMTGTLPQFIAQPPDDLDPERVDLDDYVAYAGDNNTDMMIGQSDMRAQEFKLSSAKKAWMPTFDALLSATDSLNDGGNISTQRKGSALLQLSYKLFDGHAAEAQQEMAAARLSELRINLEKTRRELAKRVKLAYNQLKSLEAERRHTEAEVKSSEALQDLNRVNFKLGSISIIELIEGEERLNNARDRMYGQTSDIFVNTYGLLLATGYLKKAYFCKTCGDGGAPEGDDAG